MKSFHNVKVEQGWYKMTVRLKLFNEMKIVKVRIEIFWPDDTSGDILDTPLADFHSSHRKTCQNENVDSLQVCYTKYKWWA